MPDVVGSRILQWFAEGFLEAFYGMQVTPYGHGGKVSTHEFFAHPFHQWGHRDLLSLMTPRILCGKELSSKKDALCSL